MGIHDWIGYETLHLAEGFRWFKPTVRLRSAKGAEELVGGLGRGELDAACLTLALLAEGPAPDLVILDLHMPIMNGEETLWELRKSHPTLSALRATDFLDARTEALLKGDPHLSTLAKPNSMGELREALRRVGEASPRARVGTTLAGGVGVRLGTARWAEGACAEELGTHVGIA